MRSPPRSVWLLACWLVSWSSISHAQTRRVELHFTPTARAQLAVWVESDDGALFQTVRLTQAVSFRGIGNRPGATQMNSGYRWPYGRREGVLPIWAHRRVAFGGERFGRVIFNGRVSEGNASSAGSAGEPINTTDAYFCLSFTPENSERENLDAVTCASQFASNKGRYLTPLDHASGYAEPFQNSPSEGVMAPLPLGSLYPPRRDVQACTFQGCGDHDDVHSYNSDARAVMPEIDSVTMATPSAEVMQRIVFDVPETWPDGDYIAHVEINVEGDYNETHNDATHPTPNAPAGMWDYWALMFGYPYRGQPSVLYRVPFRLVAAGGSWTTSEPAGYGAMHGEDGDVRTMNDSIVDDPELAPGSGADRLQFNDGMRMSVIVPAWDACRRPNPPSSCGLECDPQEPNSCGADLRCTAEGKCIGICEGITPGPDQPSACGERCDADDPRSCEAGLLCADDGTCVGVCEVPMRPSPITDVVVTQYPDRRQAHQYARLRFAVPESARGLSRFEVRVGTEPIVDAASFERALPAVQASMEAAELTVPVDVASADVIEVDFGGLLPELLYYVGIRAFDDCNVPSEIATAEFTTPTVYFTTVTACFVATAAYGTPLASEIGVLRRFRDRVLLTHGPGRALVHGYYAVGPMIADVIRERPWLRSVVRTVLAPVIALLETA